MKMAHQRANDNGGHDDGRHQPLQGVQHMHCRASTIEECQRLVITSRVKNQQRLNIKSKLLYSNRLQSQPELASDLSILYYMFKWQSWPLLPYPCYWRSLWFWRNLILCNLCSAGGLHHQGTCWLGGIAYPRYLVR
jgi:hypothetical protein